MWPFKRRHRCKYWSETQCRRFVPYIPINLTAPKRKIERMTTHVLKATFPDGETLEHPFAVGDIIVLGYETDPYKRTVPLMEGGSQLATIEIRTSGPRIPSPTFEVVKKPTSVIPTDCRESCAIAHSVAAMQAELAAARNLIEILQGPVEVHRASQHPPATITRGMLEAHLDRFPNDMKANVIRVVFGPAWTDDSAPFWSNEIEKSQSRDLLVQLAEKLTLEDRQRAGQELRASAADIISGRLHGSLLRHLQKDEFNETAIDDVSLDVG